MPLLLEAIGQTQCLDCQEEFPFLLKKLDQLVAQHAHFGGSRLTTRTTLGIEHRSARCGGHSGDRQILWKTVADAVQ